VDGRVAELSGARQDGGEGATIEASSTRIADGVLELVLRGIAALHEGAEEARRTTGGVGGAPGVDAMRGGSAPARSRTAASTRTRSGERVRTRPAAGSGPRAGGRRTTTGRHTRSLPQLRRHAVFSQRRPRPPARHPPS
jgi:hypothetical protein